MTLAQYKAMASWINDAAEHGPSIAADPSPAADLARLREIEEIMKKEQHIIEIMTEIKIVLGQKV